MAFKKITVTANISNLGFSNGSYTFELVTNSSFVDTEYLLMHKICSILALTKGSKWRYDAVYSNVVIISSVATLADSEALSYTVN